MCAVPGTQQAPGVAPNPPRENEDVAFEQGFPGRRVPWLLQGRVRTSEALAIDRDNMKSKVREIVVDSHSYIWAVTERDWHTVNIKVWAKGNRRTPWFEV
jgi:hypothetical protein